MPRPIKTRLPPRIRPMRTRASRLRKLVLPLLGALLSAGCSLSPSFLKGVRDSDFVQKDEHKVYHKVSEPPDGSIKERWYQFLHGFPDHSQNQLRLARELRKSGHVLLYDRLGFGLSDKPNIRYSIAEQVENLKWLQDKLASPPGHIIGHSYGGLLAVYYAAQYPDRVRSLTLINPALINESGHNRVRQWDTYLLQLPILGEFFELFHGRWATSASVRGFFHDREKITADIVDNFHYPFQTPGSSRSFLRTLRNLFSDPEIQQENILQRMSEVRASKIPVFLVWGKNDPTMLEEDAFVIAQTLGAKLHFIDECGHNPQLELGQDRLVSDLVSPIVNFTTSAE